MENSKQLQWLGSNPDTLLLPRTNNYVTALYCQMIFSNMTQFLFSFFSFFVIFMNKIMKKHTLSAWDSNPGDQERMEQMNSLSCEDHLFEMSYNSSLHHSDQIVDAIFLARAKLWKMYEAKNCWNWRKKIRLLRQLGIIFEILFYETAFIVPLILRQQFFFSTWIIFWRKFNSPFNLAKVRLLQYSKRIYTHGLFHWAIR